MVEQLFQPVDDIDSWLEEITPDLVLVTPLNLRFSGETDLVKSLLKMKIPYCVLTLTWDNLSTKGIFQFQPEKLLVWNKEQSEDAKNLHGLPAEKIVICGAPFFDKWKNFTQINKKSKLTNHRTKSTSTLRIVYLGSSANIIKDETQLIETIRNQLNQSSVYAVRNSKLYVRYHPANWQQGSNLNHQGIEIPASMGTLPSAQNEIEEFAALLLNSHCCIGVNTSAMIDAVLLGKVVFSPLISKSRLKQAKSLHYQRMVSTGAVVVCKDVPNLIKKSRNYRLSSNSEI